MKDIGIFLKDKREERGISLEQVEESLKIRKKYLVAIEDGNLNIIPGKAFIVGYLRNYCKYLEISEGEINGIIKSYKGIDKQKAKNVQKRDEKISLRKKRNRSFERKGVPLNLRYVYLSAFILILIGGLLFVNNYLKEAKDYPIPSPEVASISEESTITENIAHEESTEAMIENQVEEIILPEEVVVEKIPVIKVMAKTNTWIKMLSDETLLFEGILLKDEEMKFKTKNKIKLSTLFPDNLLTYIDDEEIDLNQSTKDGQIYEYVIDEIGENS